MVRLYSIELICRKSPSHSTKVTAVAYLIHNRFSVGVKIGRQLSICR